MCRQYINIKHPAIPYSLDGVGMCNYIPNYTPLSLTVPCGICEQCQNIKQKEWQLRLRYELEAVKSSGGYCWKEELTYSPCHVSHLGANFMCFNKTHVQTFIKKLRMTIQRRGLDVKLKYFVACEYGGNCTHRPHYHMLLFVYGDYKPYLLNRDIQKCWIYGYTNQNKGRKAKPHWSIYDKIVQSYAGVEYVTKYLFKDKSFFDGLVNQADKSVVENIAAAFDMNPSELLVRYSSDETFYIEVVKYLRKSVFKDAIPFSLKSQRLGISLLDHLSFDDAVRGTFNDEMTSRLQFIPIYYKRKLLYDYCKLTRCFVKNEKYIDYLWSQKLKELDRPHDILCEIPQLPDELKFQYDQYLTTCTSMDLWVAYDLYKILKNYVPGTKKVSIPSNLFDFSITEIYKHLIYQFKERDLFYSSLLRMEFNLNDCLYNPNDATLIDRLNLDCQKFYIDSNKQETSLTLLFEQIDNFILQSKQEVGKYICKQIKDKYIADKYNYIDTNVK